MKGTSEWLTISDPYLEYAKATYDAEGNLTITLYPTEDLSTSVSVEGNGYAGTSHKVKTTFTNTGDERQLTLHYWIKTDPDYFDNTWNEDLKYELYSGVTALKGATHTDVVSFTPYSEGTYYIWVTKDEQGKEVLAKTQVTIKANPHIDNGLALSEFNPKGLQSTTVHSNGDIVQEVFAPSIYPESFRITNTSGYNLTNAVITFNLWKKNGESWTAQKGSSLYNPINLKAGKGMKINGWSFVEGVGEYVLELVCNGVVTDSRYINTHEAYVVANAYSKLTPTEYSEGSITTPADATALALDNIVSNSVTITPNANPNTLYYLNAEMNATGLADKNVINVNMATSIALEDGYDFSVAYNFLAQDISYKRTFEAGWTTLTVPFDVTTIPEGITALAFVSENGSEVTFKQVSTLKAFAPYLVKAETAKTITFTGSNQQLWSEFTDTATARNLKFMGVTTKPANSQAYVLNADGTKFELTTSPTYQSFRCYFVPTYGAASLPSELTIKSDATGIEHVNKNDNKAGVKKYVKEGKLVIETAKGTFSATGTQVR